MTLNPTLKSAQSIASLSMRPSRKPRIILIFLIALCALFVYSYASRLAEKSGVDAEIVAMQARIKEAKSEQYELLEELDNLSQPDYIDRVAREKFDRAKPGDKVLVIVDEPSLSAAAADAAVGNAAPANPIDYRNFPIWQQWVVFFTTDSFTLSIQ
jgi:cell division protein FtsB